MDILSMSICSREMMSAACDVMVPSTATPDLYRLQFSAQEVANYIIVGEEKKVCSMMKHCNFGPSTKVWQASTSAYCHAVHVYAPHPGGRQCAICKHGGSYVPLINLVCFYKLSEVLTMMLKMCDNLSVGGIYGTGSNHMRSYDDLGFQAAHVCVVVDSMSGLRDLLSWMDEPDHAYFKQNSLVVPAILKRSTKALTVLCDTLDRSYLEHVYEVCIPQSGCTQAANPLQLIVRDGYISPWLEGMELLLKHGVDVDVEDDCGRTPMFYAVEYGQPGTIQGLTKYKADINHMDSYGRTPLSCVFSSHSTSQSLDLVRMLLELGADQLIADTGNLLPLDKAIKLNRTKCLETLIRFCHPLDLFSLACDHLKVVAQFKKMHRVYNRLSNLQQANQTSIQTILHVQLGQELKLWLWICLWLIMGTGRLLAPMLVKHIRFDPIILESLDETNQELYGHVQGLIEEYQTEPISLKEICRFRIRFWLENVLEKTVYSLPLPKLLARYLMFEDVIAECEFLSHKDA